MRAAYDPPVRFGLFLPPFGELADPLVCAEVAATAEATGWDGVFLWDHVQYRPPVEDVADPWIVLAAIAARTERVVIGPLVTPLARRRPQIVARQTTTLDHLSQGRLVLGVGIGLDSSGRELSSFEEEPDARARAGMLDEALELITELWSGREVDHRGEHYAARSVRFVPRRVQQPRIPIWVAARAGNLRPLRRAARWDGLFLIDQEDPAELAAAVAAVAAHRGDDGAFEVVVTGDRGDDPAPWQAAGATWWLTGVDPFTVTAEQAAELADEGPPRSG